MPIRSSERQLAIAAQARAAHDDSPHVRVVAGPGTGKSATIGERISYLLDQGVDPKSITAISFTRAAAQDLRGRVRATAQERGQESVNDVRVETLHGLALGALKRAGLLSSDPVVLDKWELRHIFDSELSRATSIGTPGRCGVVREDHEAFWALGNFEAPGTILQEPPVNETERQSFRAFHTPRTQLYSCVLPGEIVAQCVRKMDTGGLDVAELLELKHLIVDEFQDLNPMDLRFIHGLADAGVTVFAAGDDDQSLYAFRHATPRGIQEFTQTRDECGDHSLDHCFRCTPAVLKGAMKLMETYGGEQRLEKKSASLWDTADPRVPGALGCWKFKSGKAEAEAVASSCGELIAAGIEPRDIMILVANKTHPTTDVQAALEDKKVPFAPVREEDIVDTDAGRAGYAVLSIVVNPTNYVAHRSLLGVQAGVGVGVCNDIARTILESNLNYLDIFYRPLPSGLLKTRAEKAVRRVAEISANLAGWSTDDPLSDRLDEICRMIGVLRDDESAAEPLRESLEHLPQGMTLGEAHSYLRARRDDDKRDVLEAAAKRLEIDPAEIALIPNRVQVMTIHSSKGLSAQVVFIPGLEESILPGEKRGRIPGLVMESARMLYVALTRARIACAASYAETRIVQGKPSRQQRSQFADHLGKPFEERDSGGISSEAAKHIHAWMEEMAKR